MERQKQVDRVLAYIYENGSINPLQALGELGIMRLASRVSDLKKQGHDIEKRMVVVKNRYGENVHFAEYRIREAK